MKKRISMLLIICMALTMLPVTAFAGGGPGYYNVWVGGTDVADGNNVTYWLNDGDGGITPIGACEDNYNAKFDPSGEKPTLTLTGAYITQVYTEPSGVFAGSKYGIYSNSELKLVRSGAESRIVTGGTSNSRSVGVFIYPGNLIISGDGTLSVYGGTGEYSKGIYIGSGDLTIEGGKLEAAGGDNNVGNKHSYGIELQGNGHMTIKNSGEVTAYGGNVSGISYGVTSTNSSGSVIVESGSKLTARGGTSTSWNSYGIRSTSLVIDGEVTAIGSTVSAGSSYGIQSRNICISGSANVNAIGGAASTDSFGINAHNSPSIIGGTITIYAQKQAINTAPDVSGYDNVKITASDTYTGTPVAEYDSGNIANYQYLKIEQGSADVVKNITSDTGYHTLQTAINAVGDGETIKLLKSINLTSTIDIDSNQIQNFTIDLNGKTIDSGSVCAIKHGGIGILTITDSSPETEGKIISRAEAGVDTVQLQGGNLMLSGGGLINNGDGFAIYSGSGDVTISGGQVNSAKSAIASNGNVILSGGTVSATGLDEVGILIFGDYKISITGGTLIIKGAGSAIENLPDLSSYVNVKITASKNQTDGTDTSVISKKDIDTDEKVRAYKYLKFEPASALSGTATITNTTPRIGDTLTASLDGGNNTGTLTYVWKVDGIQVGTGASYKVNVAALGKSITLEIASSVETGTVAATPTTAVAKKAGPPAPAAPTLVSKTHNTIILTANDVYEFSNDGVEWKADTVFVGLIANTAYTLYQRVAETADTEPSAASKGFRVTTDVDTYTITASPTTVNFGSLTVGYSAPDAETITITNTGNSSLTLTQPTSSNYTIGALSTTTLAAGGWATFTLTPKSGLEVGNYNETLTINTDHGTNARVELSFTVAPLPTLFVTFSPNGGTVGEQSRSVASGAEVGTLPIPIRSGSYSFDGWYTAAEGGDPIFSSTIVSNNVTYYAHWTYTGGGGNSGGFGSGRASNDNNSITIIPPTATNPDRPTQGEIKLPAVVDDKGNASLVVTDKNVTDVFDKALAEAKKGGNEERGISLIFRMATGGRAATNARLNLPKSVQKTIIEKKIANTILVVDNPDIKIDMDLDTVKEINSQANSDVNITVKPIESGKLSEIVAKVIGNRPIFDLAVNYGNSKQVESFGRGRVSVTIPYTLQSGEKAENIKAVYIDSKGKLHWLEKSTYNSVSKLISFTTNHFSTYGVACMEDGPAFTDIDDHWAKADIDFATRRGLFVGISATSFSPDKEMTRGMFVTVLGRLADADISGYNNNIFSDVKDKAYYNGYIQWASKNSIVNGIGNSKFSPDGAITREQMATIIANYLKARALNLPAVKKADTFADVSKISPYAKDAINLLQGSGILSGKNNNRFDPKATASRAEVAVVLHRLMEMEE